MILLLILSVGTVISADKLDRTYLPPPGSKFSGGSPDAILPPIEPNFSATTDRPQSRGFGSTKQPSFFQPNRPGFETIHQEIPTSFGTEIDYNNEQFAPQGSITSHSSVTKQPGFVTSQASATSISPSQYSKGYTVPTTTTSYAFTQTTTFSPLQEDECFGSTCSYEQGSFVDTGIEPDISISQQGPDQFSNLSGTHFDSSKGKIRTQTQSPIISKPERPGFSSQYPSKQNEKFGHSVDQQGRPILISQPDLGLGTQFIDNHNRDYTQKTDQQGRPIFNKQPALSTETSVFDTNNRDYTQKLDQQGRPIFRNQPETSTGTLITDNNNRVYTQEVDQQGRPIFKNQPELEKGTSMFDNKNQVYIQKVDQEGRPITMSDSVPTVDSQERPISSTSNIASDKDQVLKQQQKTQSYFPTQFGSSQSPTQKTQQSEQHIDSQDRFLDNQPEVIPSQFPKGPQQPGDNVAGKLDSIQNIDRLGRPSIDSYQPNGQQGSFTTYPTSISPPESNNFGPGSYETYPNNIVNQGGIDNTTFAIPSIRPQADSDKNSVILSYKNIITPEGEFEYSFDTSNGIHADENGTASDGVRAEGSYSYIGDDGKMYSIVYTADENGFQPKGDHLPTPPPIPEAILRVIEKANQDKAAGIVDDGLYDEEKYGYHKYQGVMDLIKPYNIHRVDSSYDKDNKKVSGNNYEEHNVNNMEDDKTDESIQRNGNLNRPIMRPDQPGIFIGRVPQNRPTNAPVQKDDLGDILDMNKQNYEPNQEGEAFSEVKYRPHETTSTLSNEEIKLRPQNKERQPSYRHRVSTSTQQPLHSQAQFENKNVPQDISDETSESLPTKGYNNRLPSYKQQIPSRAQVENANNGVGSYSQQHTDKDISQTNARRPYNKLDKDRSQSNILASHDKEPEFIQKSFEENDNKLSSITKPIYNVNNKNDQRRPFLSPGMNYQEETHFTTPTTDQLYNNKPQHKISQGSISNRGGSSQRRPYSGYPAQNNRNDFKNLEVSPIDSNNNFHDNSFDQGVQVDYSRPTVRPSSKQPIISVRPTPSVSIQGYDSSSQATTRRPLVHDEKETGYRYIPPRQQFGLKNIPVNGSGASSRKDQISNILQITDIPTTEPITTDVSVDSSSENRYNKPPVSSKTYAHSHITPTISTNGYTVDNSSQDIVPEGTLEPYHDDTLKSSQSYSSSTIQPTYDHSSRIPEQRISTYTQKPGYQRQQDANRKPVYTTFKTPTTIDSKYPSQNGFGFRKGVKQPAIYTQDQGGITQSSVPNYTERNIAGFTTKLPITKSYTTLTPDTYQPYRKDSTSKDISSQATLLPTLSGSRRPAYYTTESPKPTSPGYFSRDMSFSPIESRKPEGPQSFTPSIIPEGTLTSQYSTDFEPIYKSEIETSRRPLGQQTNIGGLNQEHPSTINEGSKGLGYPTVNKVETFIQGGVPVTDLHGRPISTQDRVKGEDFRGPKQPSRFDPETGYHY